MVKVLLCLVSLYSTPVDTLPQSPGQEVLSGAMTKYEAQAFDEAIAMLADIAVEHDDYVAAQELLVRALYLNGRQDEALAVAERLREEAIDLSADFYVHMAGIYDELGMNDLALELCLDGLDVFPYNHLLLYNTGYAYYQRKEYEQAVTYFQQGALLRPFFSPFHQMLGNVMSKTSCRSKAMLSYITYLAIEPNENWALLRLNDLVNDALREEGSVELNVDNTAFAYFDDLLRSRASFDPRFRSGVEFDAPAAQQTEMLLKKLQYKPGTGDFWMDFYVPYLQKIAEKGLTTDMVYFLLYSSGNETVMKWLDRHQEENDRWITITNENLSENKLRNRRTIMDSTGVFSHWFAEDGELLAIGSEAPTGVKTGPFEYYHENGRLKSRGKYDLQGRKVGLWRYYHVNGVLQSVKYYNNEGEIDGTVWSTDEKDRLASKSVYVDGKMDGTYRAYYPSGQLREEVDYQWGRKHGEQRLYFSSGKIKEERHWVQDQMEGWHRTYLEDGSLQSENFHGNGKM